jgi:hypothetical protein
LLPPQLGSHVLQFDGLFERGIVAVPLNEVSATHECAVRRGAAIALPQIELGEVDGVAERREARRGTVAAGQDDALVLLR